MIPLIAAVILLSCAACRQPAQKPAATRSNPSVEKWQVWSDALMSFEYPSGWVVRDPKHAEGVENSWIVSIPEAGLGTLGLINMVRNSSPWGELSLEDMARKHLGNINKQWDRQFGPVTKVGVAGGDCITFNIEGWVDGCSAVNLMTNKRVPCVSPSMNAYCRSSRGDHYQILSRLSIYHENGKPNDEARANARIFERFLRSLEFKKG